MVFPEAILSLASAGSWLHDVLWGGLVQTVYQILYVAGPFFGLGLVLHRLETAQQGRLARRFGWKSVLWTGWLGTPIHELSHAAMCVVFRHRIEKMALFEPDAASKRMGYVDHSYDLKNPYQVTGGFFIAIAPLVGGSLVLYGLLWLFEPQAAQKALDTGRVSAAVAGGNLFSALKALIYGVLGVLDPILRVRNLTSLEFWLFLYLVLCIGCHVAPSRADYKGAKWGGLLLLFAILVFNVLFLAFGGTAGAVTTALASVLGPMLALLVLASVLSGLTTLLVISVTGGS